MVQQPLQTRVVVEKRQYKQQQEDESPNDDDWNSPSATGILFWQTTNGTTATNEA